MTTETPKKLTLAAVLGVLGFVIALINITLTVRKELSPFRLEGTAGPITLLPNNPGGQSQGAFFLVPITLSNEGAQSDAVTDIVLRVRHGDDTEICAPMMIMDLQGVLQAVTQHKPMATAFGGPFVPPILSGHAQTSFSLAFQCDQMASVLAWLEQGHVTFDGMARQGQQSSYTVLFKHDEDVAQPDLRKGLAVGNSTVMLDASANDLRKALASTH